MTPTLTNAQKYSPGFGFEPGVVVAVNRRSTPPYFDDGITIYGELDRVRDDIIAVGGTLIRIDDIVSIRLLSGRWGIWNFAPPDAIGVEVYKESFFTWFDDIKVFEYVSKDGDGYDYVYMPRPWWMGEVEN
jgi:hypothetical protein